MYKALWILLVFLMLGSITLSIYINFQQFAIQLQDQYYIPDTTFLTADKLLSTDNIGNTTSVQQLDYFIHGDSNTTSERLIIDPSNKENQSTITLNYIAPNERTVSDIRINKQIQFTETTENSEKTVGFLFHTNNDSPLLISNSADIIEEGTNHLFFSIQRVNPWITNGRGISYDTGIFHLSAFDTSTITTNDSITSLTSIYSTTNSTTEISNIKLNDPSTDDLFTKTFLLNHNEFTWIKTSMGWWYHNPLYHGQTASFIYHSGYWEYIDNNSLSYNTGWIVTTIQPNSITLYASTPIQLSNDGNIILHISSTNIHIITRSTITHQFNTVFNNSFSLAFPTWATCGNPNILSSSTSFLIPITIYYNGNYEPAIIQYNFNTSYTSWTLSGGIIQHTSFVGTALTSTPLITIHTSDNTKYTAIGIPEFKTVYLMTYTSSIWTSASTINVNSTGFGTTILLNYDATVLVIKNSTDQGAIWIYHRTPDTDTWTNVLSSFCGSGASSTANFGMTLKMNTIGTRIFAGSTDSKVWILGRELNSSTWTVTHSIIDPIISTLNNFGTELVINGYGSVIAILSNIPHIIYIYSMYTGSWTLLKTITSANGTYLTMNKNGNTITINNSTLYTIY